MAVKDPIDATGAQLLDLIGGEEPLVVMFTASWCGPCKQMKPMVERLAGTAGLQVVRVDAGADQDVQTAHQIRGVPTIAVFRDGSEVARVVGTQTEARIAELLGKVKL
ncbi:Thioredoxin [compost metagenome]